MWAGVKHQVRNFSCYSVCVCVVGPDVLKAALFLHFYIRLLKLIFVCVLPDVAYATAGRVYALCELRETGWVDLSRQVPAC